MNVRVVVEVELEIPAEVGSMSAALRVGNAIVMGNLAGIKLERIQAVRVLVDGEVVHTVG